MSNTKLFESKHEPLVNKKYVLEKFKGKGGGHLLKSPKFYKTNMLHLAGLEFEGQLIISKYRITT